MKLISKPKDMRGDTDRVAEVRNRRASILSPITLLKMARTSNARFDRSANALGWSESGPVSVGLEIFPRSYFYAEISTWQVLCLS